MFPSASEALTLTTLTDLVRWYNVDPAVWNAFVGQECNEGFWGALDGYAGHAGGTSVQTGEEKVMGGLGEALGRLGGNTTVELEQYGIPLFSEHLGYRTDYNFTWGEKDKDERRPGPRRRLGVHPRRHEGDHDGLREVRELDGRSAHTRAGVHGGATLSDEAKGGNFTAVPVRGLRGVGAFRKEEPESPQAQDLDDAAGRQLRGEGPAGTARPHSTASGSTRRLC